MASPNKPKNQLETKKSERRRWDRLPLAIPVFVRGTDDRGERFIEFSTALDISAGGALLAVKRKFVPGCKLTLEIPHSPIAGTTSHSQQVFPAKLMRSSPGSDCQLLGLKFARPLRIESRPTGRKSLS